MERGNRAVEPKMETSSNENWLLSNVVNPFLNTAAVEPLKVIEDAGNAASKQLTGQEWLPQVQLQKINAQVKPWSAEFFAQNIASGLAMVLPYGAAGRLTAGSLRLISKVPCLRVGAQALVKSQRVREVGANIIRSNKTGQILGAGIYDFAKEPEREKEKGGAGTSSGEHAPPLKERLANGGAGAASFAVYEAMNPLLHKSGIVGKFIEQSGLAKKLAVKAAGLFTIGAAGSVVGSVTRTGVNEGRLIRPEEIQDDVLSGGAMNVLLPTVQHGIGKGVNFVNKKLGRGVSIQDYEGEGDANIKDLPGGKELVNKNAFCRIQPTENSTHSVDVEAELIKLGKGATAKDVAHELAHLLQRTDKARDEVFAGLKKRLQRIDTETQETKDSPAVKQELASIKHEFIEQRVKDEVNARLIEQKIAHELESRLADTNTKLQTEKELFDQVNSDSRYQQLFERQYADFVGSKRMPQEDYALSADDACNKDNNTNHVDFRLRQSSDQAARADVLSRLAKDRNENIRLAVARNPATGADALKILAYDLNEHIRRAVAMHPTAGADVLATLARDKRYHVRLAVAENSSATADVLRILAYDLNANLRLAVARHPAAGADVLNRLARDEDFRVRQAVTRRPAAGADVLEKPADDYNRLVSELALQDSDSRNSPRYDEAVQHKSDSRPESDRHVLSEFSTRAGIEDIQKIPDTIFKQLPDNAKKLWKTDKYIEKLSVIEDLLQKTDKKELIAQLSDDDCKWLVQQARNIYKLKMSKACFSPERIEGHLQKVTDIVDGRTGQRVTRDFASGLIEDLRLEGLNNRQIAAAIGHLESRKEFLSITGLREKFDELDKSLSLSRKGEYFGFTSVKVGGGKASARKVNAILVGTGSPGTSLVYHFLKSAEIHHNLYRLEVLGPDTKGISALEQLLKHHRNAVIMSSPKGEKTLMSVTDDGPAARALDFDGASGNWTIGKQVDIPNFVLFDNPNFLGLQNAEKLAITELLYSLRNHDSLLIPEGLIGTVDNSKSNPGFAGDINFFDLGKAQTSAANRRSLAKQLSQSSHSLSEEGDFSELQLVERLMGVARTKESYTNELECISYIHKNLKIGKEVKLQQRFIGYAGSEIASKGKYTPDQGMPAVKAYLLGKRIERNLGHFKLINFRQVSDFFEASSKLCKQLVDKLPATQNDKDLLYVVLQKEGSAHFVHEVYRQANGFDNRQFVCEADLRRMASNGEIKNKTLVLLDDGFDWGDACYDKLGVVRDIIGRIREKHGDLPPRYVPRQAESLTFCGLSASSAWFECLAA